jgi:phenylacetate-CoA ligase
MIWNEKYECMGRKDLEALQSKRLREVVETVCNKVPFYQNRFLETGIVPSQITSLESLPQLPFTVKDDLRENYPFGLLTTDLTDIVEIHASSGTTGTVTVVAYSREDVALWAEVMARTLACTGGTSADIVHNAYGYGLFTGGLGIHYGALELGAAVVPISSGGTKRQIKLMQDFGATILTCTPSYALHMAEVISEMGVDPALTSIKIGVFGAEPWSEGMRRELEKTWDITACDIYGLSEIIGPGVAVECPGKDGLHLWADHFLPEIINPNTGEVLDEGQDGELVLTTLTKKAMPLIRYRTGDITSITYQPCPHCGRTSPRISKLKGRTDDMLVIRGVNVFPSQVESVLLEIEEAKPHYQLVVTRSRGLDELEVWVEVDEKFFSDEIKKLETLEKKIQSEIESVLALRTRIKLVEPKSIERSMGKAKRVIDKRVI